MWDATLTFVVAIIISTIVFGYPIYWAYNKWLNKPEPKNFPFREPCIYTNMHGHLVMVEPDPEIQQRVTEYYRRNPKKAREKLDGLRDIYDRW